MSELLGSVWWLIVTLGVLVTFHEFGHFVVARRCGVKVLKFSIGFGKALWSRFDRQGTQYVIAAITNCVPWRSKRDQSAFPKPTENFSTLTPQRRATTKWPNSWNVISTPSVTISHQTDPKNSLMQHFRRFVLGLDPGSGRSVRAAARAGCQESLGATVSPSRRR
jgi:hypothetical protein